MADEDDVDIVGEFSGDITLSSASTYDEMGLTINELLPYLGSNSWLMNSDQVWFMDSNVEDKANTKTVIEDAKSSSSAISSTVQKETPGSNRSPQKSHKKPWTELEKEEFQKGLEIYGNRWSKISKHIGTRTTLQVKNYARQQQLKQVKNVGKDSPSKVEVLYESKNNFDSVFDDHIYETANPTIPIHSIQTNDLNFCSNRTEKGKDGRKVSLVHSNEVIVRINKEVESGESEDVDIEDIIENDDRGSSSIEQIAESLSSRKEIVRSTIVDGTSKSLAVPDDLLEYENDSTHLPFESNDALREQRVFTFQVPDKELVLKRDVISEEEKSVHQEFFEGRPRKNPERYLKIRNFILDSWEKCKPCYLNKTSIRSGLKNCGDVNCIGRIHSYLELTGAINFGCEQTVYDRPLVLTGKLIPTLKRATPDGGIFSQKLSRIETRPRKHKLPVLTFNSEAGGYTIEHDENGLVVDIAEGSSKPIATTYVKRSKTANNNPFRLVNCSEFDLNNSAPFSVVVDVRVLVVMDIHSHLSDLEVIGLLGGQYDRESSILYILTAEPCDSLSTGLECEMDPVSQTQASEKLEQSGHCVIGWYHSHPTFSPNPSLRDLETQSKFQEWFGQGGSPFLGVIVSPHYSMTTASKIRYLVVGDETVEDGHRKPYKFSPSFTPLDHDVDGVLADAEKLVHKLMPTLLSCCSSSQSTLSKMNKLIGSIHHHLTSSHEDQSMVLSFLSELAKIIVTYLPTTTDSHEGDEITTNKLENSNHAENQTLNNDPNLEF